MNILAVSNLTSGVVYSKKNKQIQKSNTLSIGKMQSFDSVSFKANKNIIPLSEKEKKEILKQIESSKDFKQGSLGKVYKIDLPKRPTLAVKEYSSINEGRNPQKEAENLQKLPKDCKRVQKFVDLFEKNGKQYLVTTFQSGGSLSKLKDRMSDELIGNILDELFKIERAGVTFYDYSMANIVFEDSEPRFFDFEIAKKQSFDKFNIDAESDLCHMSRNTYFPYITNLAGFEIRTVGKIIGELEKYPNSEGRSNDFVKRYLKKASIFFQNTAELYSPKNKDSKIPNEAVEYSKILAKLFKNPSAEIVSIERQSMRIKELLTEYWFRNDPDLSHDDRLYSNLPEYVENLKSRFNSVQNDIMKLQNKEKDLDVQKYCKTTSAFLKKLSQKEVTYLSGLCKK